MYGVWWSTLTDNICIPSSETIRFLKVVISWNKRKSAFFNDLEYSIYEYDRRRIVINKAFAIIEARNKYRDLNGILTHGLCRTGAMLYQLSSEVTRW